MGTNNIIDTIKSITKKISTDNIYLVELLKIKYVNNNCNRYLLIIKTIKLKIVDKMQDFRS